VFTLPDRWQAADQGGWRHLRPGRGPFEL